MSCEICLLTRSFYEDDLEEWIKWHLDILKFDHLRIFDNESTIDIEKLVKGDSRISVEKVSGWPNQVALYQKAYDECKYDWIYFGDSDEFLWYDFEDYKDVNDFIEYKYMLCRMPNIAVWWRLIGCNQPLKEHECTPVRWNLYLQSNAVDSMCKCFYKIKGNFKWNRIFVHVPEPTMYTSDIMGNVIRSSALHNPEIIPKQDAMIFHYYHRTFEEWLIKQKQQNPTRPGIDYTTMVPQAETFEEYRKIIEGFKYDEPDNRIFMKLYPEECD